MFTPRNNEDTPKFILRWAARVCSVLVFMILMLLYVGGNLILSQVGPGEIVGLIFFPFGLLAGFALGWHDELFGGFLSVLSAAAFYLIYGLLLNGSIDQGWAVLVLTVPGLLFLAYGLIHSPRAHFPGRSAHI